MTVLPEANCSLNASVEAFQKRFDIILNTLQLKTTVFQR